MEEKLENIPNTPEPHEREVSWDDLEAGMRAGQNFFKPGVGKQYRIRIESAVPKESAKYEDKNGNPKLKVSMVLSTINGAPANGMRWETGSWDIMGEVKKAVASGNLKNTEWLLKKSEDNGKVSYIFENLGASAPSPSSSGLEALL